MFPPLFIRIPQTLITLRQLCQFNIGKLFDSNHLITGAADGADYFIELLQMQCPCITVLDILDEENNEECYDRCSCVDN